MLKASLPEEQQLLKQVATGNAEAYTRLFHHYSPYVYEVAMVYLKDAGLAREIVQEVFLRIWVKQAAMAAIQKFDDYLFILTRNYIYDGFKKRVVRLRAHDLHLQRQPAAGNDTDQLLLRHDYEKLLDAAISHLPPARKKVYVERNQGYSNEEISQRLNISIHTVKKQWSLAAHFVRAFVKAQLQREILPLLVLIGLFW
ncbi:MAG TPA: sigma-70 family RNA polymerase sigma factor [Chitinophaga sp.]